MRIQLNCWVAAMWVWLAGSAKQYAWIRRSHSFYGLIPHFGYSERIGLRRFRSIEYRPPKKKWTRKNMLFAFEGTWVVTHYRLVAVRRWPSKELAMNDFWRARE